MGAHHVEFEFAGASDVGSGRGADSRQAGFSPSFTPRWRALATMVR